MLNIVILLDFFHLKNMLPDNLNKICGNILALLLPFPMSVLFGLIQSHLRWNIIRFYFRRKEIKKKNKIKVESLTSVLGLPF